MRRPRRSKSSRVSALFWGVVVVLCALSVVVQRTGRLSWPPGPPRADARGHGHARGHERGGDTTARVPPPAPLPQGEIASSVHVTLGVPTDADPSDDYLMDERAYVVSYNPSKGVPNWVAWELHRGYLGHVARRNDFRPDPLLPSTFHAVVPQDYAHTAYDRGHMCPSGDRADDPEDNSLTFLMTNMQPQLHELNAGPWEKLEEYERELAKAPDAELFIVAGGVFGATFDTIGHGVAVPRANFKIIVQLARGQRATDVTRETYVLAVMMPNEPGVGHRAWTELVTSVDEIEKATGYDFLTSVAKPVQDAIEARVARPN